jgi:WD40 repeat protein
MNSIRPKTATQYTSDTEIPLEWNVGDLVLGTYEVKEIFDSGAMAFVYRVHHRDWDIDLAVKSPKPGKLNLGGPVDLFVREAETWVNLGLYPHIVSCYYIRVLGGVPRIFMEFVDGTSLLEAIEDGSLYQGSNEVVLRRLLDIAIQFAWGLHYAHEKGLVHQDVKPANVMLTRDNIAKVTDFGMAQAKDKLLRREEGAKIPVMSADGESILVDTIGMTPAYCSPEQAATQPLSRRTDMWSWAVSVLEMFFGEITWQSGPTASDSLEKYIKERSAEPLKPAIPGSMFDLLRCCLSENPEDRPEDMRLVAANLQAVYRRETGQHYQRPEPHVKTTLTDTLNNRGVSMADLGNDKEAIELFDEALQAESTHPTAIYNRGLNLWRSGYMTDQDAVAALLDNQKNLADLSETTFLLSLLHLERGNSEKAARILEDAIETYGARPALKRIHTLTKQTSKISGRCLKTFSGHESPVNAVAITSDGDTVFSGGNDEKVRMWQVETEECVKEFSGHTHLVQTVALSPDEKYLLSGSWDHSIRLWEIDSGECMYEFTEHTDIIQQVAFTPDGEFAVSASSDCTLRVWDLHSGDNVRILSGHFDTVSAFAISRDGKKIISASYDNSLRVWDLDSGECEKTIDWVKSCTSNLALCKDGKQVLLAGADTLLWLVDLETGEPVRSFSGHEGTVRAVEIAPNDTWVLSASTDGMLRLWDLKTTRCLRTFTGHEASVNAVAVCPKKVLAVTGSSEREAVMLPYGCGG